VKTGGPILVIEYNSAPSAQSYYYISDMKGPQA